jgi:tRNA(fMet)-specific endonuclease VapC
VILDTNAVSALADGDSALARVLADVARFTLPVIVIGEFRFGLARSRHRERYERWLASLVTVSAVADVDLDTATHYARLRDELRTAGRPIPSNDTWIAALAVQHGLPVVSRDEHFDQVDQVRRIQW